MADTVHIEEVFEFSEEISKRVKYFVTLLDANYQPLSDDDVRGIIASPTTRLLIAKVGEKIVGMLTLVIYRIPYKKKGWLEDLVVDPEEREKGVGTKLLESAITLARKEQVKAIDFTSQPMRESANALYQKLGFEKRNTNVYRLVLS